MEPSLPSANKKRWRIWLVAGLALLALAVAGWRYWQEEIRPSQELAAAHAEADRHDPGWRLEDQLAARRAISDEENAALRVILISQAMPQYWPSHDRFAQMPSATDSPNHLLSASQRQALEAELKDAAAALAKVELLADQPSGRYPIDLKPDYVSTSRDYFLPIRNVVYLLPSYADDDAGDRALMASRAALNAARSVGDEPMMVAMLIRSVAAHLAWRELERCLALSQPSTDELARCQQLLELEVDFPYLLIGFRGERAGMDQFYQHLANQGYPAETLKAMGAEPPDFLGTLVGDSNGKPPGQDLPVSPVDIRRTRVESFRFFTQAVEIAKLPLEQQAGPLLELERQMADLTPLTRKWVANVLKAVQKHRLTLASLRATIVGLACERYRIQHDRWPESLGQLVPEFLAVVPLDPIDGKPLRYRRLDHGIMVYSIGQDNTDNGGNIVRVRNLHANGTNLGFQLWHPDLRRQKSEVKE